MGNDKVIKMVGTKKEAEKENKIKEFIDMTGQVAAMLGPDVIGDDEALKMFQRYTASLSNGQTMVKKMMSKKDMIEKMIDENSCANVFVRTFSEKEREAMQDGVGKFIKRTCNFTYFGGYHGLDREEMIKLFTGEGDSREDAYEQVNLFMETISQVSCLLTDRIALKYPEFNATCFTFAALSKPDTVSDEYFNEKIEEELLARVTTCLSKEEIRTAYRIGFGFPIN